MNLHDQTRSRLDGLVVVAGLLLLGLVGRILYIGAGVEQIAAVHGLELEVFHQHPGMLRQNETVEAFPQPARVRVPALLNHTFDEAGHMLLGSGLTLEGKGDPQGQVTRQEPAPGRLVPAGTAVRVWLAGSR